MRGQKSIRKIMVALAVSQLLPTLGSQTAALAQNRMPAAFTKIETSGEGKPTSKILFIGQSILFTYNTPHIFHMIASAKRPSENYLIELVAQGGYSLIDHYNDGTALKELRRERWNYVIIAESTANQIINYPPYEKYAPFFDQEARKVGAVPIQFECYDESTVDDAHSRMHKEVVKVATALAEPIIPVGSVWRYCTKYLPSIPIFGPDYHHPSVLGSYLMACTIYSKIYRESAAGAHIILESRNPRTGKIEPLDSSTNPQMKLLAGAAWTVVKAGLK